MSGAKIMVIEDEVIVAMELQSRLTALGYEVTGVVGRGEDAVEKVREMAPDLLLVDITLAGRMDGIEAARRIHETHDIPVVYLTAHADDQTLERAKLSTPSGYLVKPYHESDLRTTIEVCLHKHRQDGLARDRAEWFSATVDGLGGAVIATDENHVIRHMNGLAEILTGVDHADAVGKPVGDVLVVIHAETRMTVTGLLPVHNAEVTANRDTNIGREPPWSPADSGNLVSAPMPCVLLTRDKTEIAIEISAMEVRNSPGRSSSILYCFRENTHDVAERQDWVSWAANLRLAAALTNSEARYKEAETYYRRALDILEKNLGTDHPNVAGLLDDLSAVCERIGKRDEAHLIEMRARRIRSGGKTAQGLKSRPLQRIPEQTNTM
jgi:CheY-like chemotaxis protein